MAGTVTWRGECHNEQENPVMRFIPLVLLPLLIACTMNSSAPDTTFIGTWQVEFIGTRPVIDYSPAVISFSADGQLSGNASCNRFSGAYQDTPEALSIGPLATTRMMCPPALMEQEQRMLAALSEITGARVENNRLYLNDATGNLLFKASPKTR